MELQEVEMIMARLEKKERPPPDQEQGRCGFCFLPLSLFCLFFFFFYFLFYFPVFFVLFFVLFCFLFLCVCFYLFLLLFCFFLVSFFCFFFLFPVPPGQAGHNTTLIVSTFPLPFLRSVTHLLYARKSAKAQKSHVSFI